VAVVVVAATAAFAGRRAAVAAGVFGLAATVIQVAAVTLATRPIERDWYPVFLRRWGAGMALRLLGVVALAVVVSVAGDRFPPLPAALGYVSVVVPLLFFEIRLFR